MVGFRKAVAIGFCPIAQMKVSKTTMYKKFCNGFRDDLIDGIELEGRDGIPRMLDLQNTEVPLALVPFEKIRACKDRRAYVHFYIDDSRYGEILTNPERYDSLLSRFDGVISPDPTIKIGNPRCVNACMTALNRTIGFHWQRIGIPVIPNIRWGDRETWDFCFLGVPKHSTVAISTHGAIAKNKETNDFLRTCFKEGLREMLERLEPTDVIVYGRMPPDVFTQEILAKARFHRYPSELETAHQTEEI